MTLNYKPSLLPGIFLACFLLIINALPNSGLVYPQLINSGHALVFFTANLFLLKLLLGSTYTFKQVLSISLFSLFIGFLIEYLQPFIGRDRSLLDFFYDCIGVLFSALFFIRSNTSPKKANLHLFILFILLSLGLPTYRAYLWWQINQSPTLLNFERHWEATSLNTSDEVIITSLPSMSPFNGSGYVGKVNFGTVGHYPGFGIVHPRSDWTNFATLNWVIFSPNHKPVTLNLRVHDSVHNQDYQDRFNYNFTVMPGLNRYRLNLHEIEQGPRLRRLDMKNIKGLKFFIRQPKLAVILYFDELKLE